MFSPLVALALVLTPSQGDRIPLDSPIFDRALSAGRRYDGAVLNAALAPRWLDGYLTYRAQRPGGKQEWMLVELTTGKRGVAFDDTKVAEGLRAKVVEGAVDIVGATAKTLKLRAGGKTWDLDRASGEIKEAPPAPIRESDALRAFLPPRPSGSGEATSIILENRSQQTVDVAWISTDGERRKYHTLTPGQSITQNTYAGHTWVFVSPDGKDLAAFQASEGAGLAIFDGTSPAPTPPRRGGGGSPTSPDGKHRAAIRENNVVLNDKPITTDGTADNGFRGIQWAASSRYFSAVQVEAGDERKVTIVRSSPPNQLQPNLLVFDYLKPGDKVPHERLRIFDPETGARVNVDESLSPNPYHLSNMRWIGEELTFIYNERGHQTLRWLAADPKTGKVRVLAEDKSPTFVDYSQKTYAEPVGDTGTALWMSERSGWNHLYRIELKTGKVLNPVTSGEWVVREVVSVDAAKGEALLRVMGYHKSQSPYHNHFLRVSLDGKKQTLLTEGDGNHQIRFSPDGTHYVDSYSRVDLPPVHEVRRTSDGKLVSRLEQADVTELMNRGYVMPERFVAKGRDGQTDIWGVIYKPNGYRPDGKFPVIESIYAGPHGHHIPMNFSASNGNMRLTDLGFAIVSIDGMGTNWRSKKFHDVAWRNIGDAGFPDRILWIKAAAKDRPWMDLDRVGIYGTSAGGQNAASAVMRFGDFYKAAVADCGCHDNRMDKIWWNEAWMGYPVGPWYAESSNVTAAKNLKGSLFLMVGEVDTNVDPASTTQVVDALIKAGKDFEYLIAPNVGHGVLGTPYGMRRMLEYFVRVLKPEVPKG